MRAVQGAHTSEAFEAARRLAEACADPWPLVPGELDERRSRVWQLASGTLLPALEERGGPLLAVIAGPTGVGKSTLLNGFAGRRVSAASALRPTTATPVAWCHPAHAARVRDWEFGGVSPEVAVDERQELGDLVVVDAPDFDSAVYGHRAVADALLAAADVVVFVSSPARYGDREAWNRVVDGLRREVPMLHVLNRCTAETAAQVRADLPRRAGTRGIPLEAAEVIPVIEQPIDPETLGPPRGAVGHILSLLVEIAEEDLKVAREFVLEGAVGATASATEELLDAGWRWQDAVERARASVRAAASAREVEPPPDGGPSNGPGSVLAARLRRSGDRPTGREREAVEARLAVEALDAWAGVRALWRTEPALGALREPQPTQLDSLVADPAEAWLQQDKGWDEVVAEVREAAVEPVFVLLDHATPDLDPILAGVRGLRSGS
jgi:hypothetical protein